MFLACFVDQIFKRATTKGQRFKVENILKFFFSETTEPFDSKLGWKFQEHLYLCVDKKFKMAAVAGHRFKHRTI